MGISPAMVGKHTRAQENRLGYSLINKTTRHQGLTETGRRYYVHGLQILSAWYAPVTGRADPSSLPWI
ncbi:hypothetical protein [Brenneria uluponensis]|uniref:hypothetical protein n=1 Tax=Brenneria uluponensis TaxID=3057057 RepID=UPI003CCC6C6E